MRSAAAAFTLVAILASCGGAAPALPAAATSAPSATPAAAATTRRATPAPATASPVPTVASIAKPGDTIRDITYCTMDGAEQKLDLYFPRALPAQGRAPLVVYFHGGGLLESDKRFVVTEEHPVQYARFVSAGFVFASVNYRLGPDAKFPAMIEDAKCAIRHLRSEAAKYQVDPDRIGVMGSSSGAYLAQLIGLSDSAVFEKGAYPGVSARVRAVFSDYGAETNLEVAPYSNYSADSRAKVYPANMTTEQKKAFSPITYATKDDPPMLLTHGEKDPVANPQNSKDMYARLTEVGVAATLVMVKNGGHGWDAKSSKFGPIDPTQEQLGQMAVTFFEKHLKA